jgi:AcrR family transcriptional regulator
MPGPERRQQILDIARGEFERVGVSGARIRKIAELAGVNEGLIYYYFDSKDHLFEAAVLEPLAEAIAAVAQAGKRLSDESEDVRVEDVRAGALRLSRTINSSARLIASTLFSDQEAGRTFYLERLYPALLESMEATSKGITGFAGRTVDTSTLMVATFGMHFALAMDHHFRGVPMDEEKVSREIADLVMFGLDMTDRH